MFVGEFSGATQKLPSDTEETDFTYIMSVVHTTLDSEGNPVDFDCLDTTASRVIVVDYGDPTVSEYGDPAVEYCNVFFNTGTVTYTTHEPMYLC